MGKGYSGGTVITLCAVFFFIGCLIQQLPKLPDVSSGFSKEDKKASARRRAAEIDAVTLEAADVQFSPADSHYAASTVIYEPQTDTVSEPTGRPWTFDDAVNDILPNPLLPGETGNVFHITQPMQQLSWHPRMYVFPKFIDDERCDHIVKIATDRLGPSSLAYRKNDNPNDSRDVRTSSGTFMTRFQDPAGVLAWVEEKIASLTHLPVANGEPFNILRYNLGQHYDSHYDVFNPEDYGPQESNRKATVLFYLTDVEEGGETIFPFEGANGMSRKSGLNYKSCDVGYKYRPRKGDALLFYSIHPNGTFDPHSLHGGCPVKKGMKMVMTRWIRDQCHGSCVVH